jgi:rod shape-determining protein MreC
MGLLSQHRLWRGEQRLRSAGPYSLRLPALFFLSFALLALSRLGHPAIVELRAEAEALIAPALGAAILPLEPVRRLARQVQSSYDGFAELERLKAENQRLKQWESRAHDLERRIGELATLAKALEQHRTDYRTVRVIATSSGGFRQSALLEAGTEQGIRVGQPVINADGVLGRIVEAGRRTSRVLLLTDANSRVPVLVGAGQIGAILAGDNGPEPRIVLAPQGSVFEHGEEIVTAGIGGMFPRGLRIGATLVTQSGTRALLNAGLGNLEYVSVLMLDNPGIALSRELRAPDAVQARTAGGANTAARGAADGMANGATSRRGNGTPDVTSSGTAGTAEGGRQP